MPTNNAINSNIPIEIGKGGTGSTTGAFTSVNFVTITSTSTYTPPSNLLFAIVECVGGGGGSAGIPATGGAQTGVANAGGGGGYTKKVYNRAALLPNVSVTIGSAGTAGAAGANNGGNGGNTTFLGMTASGGNGGPTVAVGAGPIGFGTAGGAASGGDINIPGSSTNLFCYVLTAPSSSIAMGYSGTSPYSSHVLQTAGNGYGGGGGQNYINQSTAATAGYAGSAGVVFITEFLA